MIYVVYTTLTSGYPDTKTIRKGKGSATALLKNTEQPSTRVNVLCVVLM